MEHRWIQNALAYFQTMEHSNKRHDVSDHRHYYTNLCEDCFRTILLEVLHLPSDDLFATNTELLIAYLLAVSDEDHNDGWARLGTGFCLDDTKDSGLQHLPAMYRSGVTLAEVKALCDKYSTCVALDFGVHQD